MPVASLEDVVASKRAAGRPKDIVALPASKPAFGAAEVVHLRPQCVHMAMRIVANRREATRA